MRLASGSVWLRWSCSLLLLAGLVWTLPAPGPAWSQEPPADGEPPERRKPPRPANLGKVGKQDAGTRKLPGILGSAGPAGRATGLDPAGDDDEATDEVTLSERYAREGVAPVLRLLQQGLYRGAAARARALTDSDPDNPKYHALLAQSWAKEGEFSDALASFRFAEGDPYYEMFGIGEHANTLRALGRPLEAAALRRSQLLAFGQDVDLAHVLVELAEDYEAAGDLSLAEDLLLEALSVTPRGAKALAAMGQFARRQGRTDDAWFWAWQARRSDTTSQDSLLLHARLLLDDGRYAELDPLLTRLRRRFPKLESVILMRAEMELTLGTASDALNIFNMHRWSGRASPEMLAMRARLLHAVGRDTEARAVLTRAWAVYASSPAVQAAAAEVGWSPPG